MGMGMGMDKGRSLCRHVYRCVYGHVGHHSLAGGCSMVLEALSGHKYIGHYYIGHDYIGHNYIGHNYIGHGYRSLAGGGTTGLGALSGRSFLRMDLRLNMWHGSVSRHVFSQMCQTWDWGLLDGPRSS